MIRKTLRVGGRCASVRLEEPIWNYIENMANSRRQHLSSLVDEIAERTPDPTKLAASLRNSAIEDARLRSYTLQSKLEELAPDGSVDEKARVLEASPLPALIVDHDRRIKLANRSFLRWLNLDLNITIGSLLENIMILRGRDLHALWDRLLDDRTAIGEFGTIYVSPGQARIAEAIAVPLRADRPVDACTYEPSQKPSRHCLVLFETLAGYECTIGQKTEKPSHIRAPQQAA